MNNIDNTKVDFRLKLWAQELHDMSGRNRLLYYKDTKTSTVIINSPSFYDLYEEVVDKGHKISVPLPDNEEQQTLFDDPNDSNDNNTTKSQSKRRLKDNEIDTNHSIIQLNKVIKNLHYTSHTIQEEQGFNILYITFGMLKWQESLNSEFSYAPLILVPVQVNREGVGKAFQLMMAEDDIVLNPGLKTKLSNDFSIELPEITNDLSTEQLRDYLLNTTSIISSMNGWEIVEKVTIGVFNFLTMLIIKDFEKHAELYQGHPIIQRLCGIDSTDLKIPDGIIDASELDDKVDPSTVFQILDADSSQQEAIEAAKKGLSFVLQGPPGTGKSQTISNIIAEFMMAGKKVLFVSQKMAALEVVQSRLSKKSLGDFCLEVHSHKIDKKKVIENLMRSLSRSEQTFNSNKHLNLQEELKQFRTNLNDYARQLHKPRYELGISLHYLHGKLSELLDEPQLIFNVESTQNLTLNKLNRITYLLKEAPAHSAIITTYKSNQWKGVNFHNCTIQAREELSANLYRYASVLSEFCVIIDDLLTRYNLPIASRFLEYMNYYNVLLQFKTGIWGNDLNMAIDHYMENYNSSYRFFNLKYLINLRKLKSVCRDTKLPPHYILLPALKTVKSIISNSSVAVFDVSLDDVPVEKIKKLHDIVLESVSFAEDLFIKDEVPSFIKNMKDHALCDVITWFKEHAETVDQLVAWTNYNHYITECKEVGLTSFINRALETDLSPVKWCNTFLRRLYYIMSESLAQDYPLMNRYKGENLAELIKRFKSNDKEIIENTPLLIRESLNNLKPKTSWINSSSAETSILRKEFNKKRRVMPLRKLFQGIPNLIVSLKPCLMMSPLTVCQLLDPYKYKFDLVVFDEASQIPPEYAVSSFLRTNQIIVAGDRQQLPPTNFFQAMEKDEYDEDDEDDTNISFESILNACDGAGFPQKMLNWHYRSKDESLIVYSNYHFYENHLFTFPSSDQNNPLTGLKYIYLPDGVYKRGTGSRYNVVEARKVAELVKEHLRNHPQYSLGVVTFSLSQRRAVEAELELMRKEHPELNGLFSNDYAEPIFIKNLENVQGDERDCIIISVGYGKDETGKMTMNFGPINRNGGARRLNVAVTRARYSLKLVTSIEPEDIDLSRVSTGGGAFLLRNYLEAARDGVKAVFKDDQINPDAEFDSPFEQSVYNELTRRGILLKPQVGASGYRIDLGVFDPEQPGRFILGIECDGAMYHSGKTARDRDRLRQEILEGLGWRIYRIWSRDWICNRDHEIEKVLKEIEFSQKLIRPCRETNSDKNKEPVVDEIEPDILNFDINEGSMNFPDIAVPYVKTILPRPRITGSEALMNMPISAIALILVDIVDTESPVSISTAKRRILDAWKTKKGSRIDLYLTRALYSIEREKKVIIDNGFLWSNHMDTPPLRYGNVKRDIEDIASEEIQVAVLECVKSAGSISSEDLTRETLRIFGLQCIQKNKNVVYKIINQMVIIERLKSNNDRISL